MVWNLSEDEFKLFITYREPLSDEILELLAGEKPTLLQSKTTGEKILKRIMNFIEIFINRISG